MQNLKREEVLDVFRQDYPQYMWSLPTLSRRMCTFGIKYVDYNTNLDDVRNFVRTEVDGPAKLPGYRMMQRKLCEQHDLAVPHSPVYNVMTDEYPEGLEARANVGQGGKRKKGPTSAFTSLVIVVLLLHGLGAVYIKVAYIDTLSSKTLLALNRVKG